MSPNYDLLGLSQGASRVEVKDAFRKLCLQYHPDKCAPEMRSAAEIRFRDIKTAYDAILRGQAGYVPPPPGTGPSAAYARAYYRAHGVEGPVRCGGPFGGFLTEMDFYRSMLRTSRNSPFVLLLTGLIAVPVTAVLTSMLTGRGEFIGRFKEEGITMFMDEKLKINGRASTINPFSIRDVEKEQHELYTYKFEKYRKFREGAPGADDHSAPEAAAPAAAGH